MAPPPGRRRPHHPVPAAPLPAFPHPRRSESPHTWTPALTSSTAGQSTRTRQRVRRKVWMLPNPGLELSGLDDGLGFMDNVHCDTPGERLQVRRTEIAVNTVALYTLQQTVMQCNDQWGLG